MTALSPVLLKASSKGRLSRPLTSISDSDGSPDSPPPKKIADSPSLGSNKVAKMKSPEGKIGSLRRPTT